MLLRHGVIRVGLPIPAGAEFELAKVDDPYGYASASELSLFRRPLAATNLRLLSTVMWDGRETFKDAKGKDCIAGTTTCFASRHFDLLDRANSATTGHAESPTPLTPALREAIADFEAGLTTAQVRDEDAGDLPARAAHGGKRADIGKFKGPTLRALATRAPYLHNGSATDLHAVVTFYDTRFGIGPTQQEQDDLVAFLKTL